MNYTSYLDSNFNPLPAEQATLIKTIKDGRVTFVRPKRQANTMKAGGGNPNHDQEGKFASSNSRADAKVVNERYIAVRNANIDPNEVSLSGGETENTARNRSDKMMSSDAHSLPPIILKVLDSGKYQVVDGNARTLTHRRQGKPINNVIFENTPMSRSHFGVNTQKALLSVSSEWGHVPTLTEYELEQLSQVSVMDIPTVEADLDATVVRMLEAQ